MAKVYKCTFNNVNGENTGVFTRTRMTKSSPSPGILYKKNCPDNLTFLADPNDGGTNSYYRLIDPQNYKINSSEKVYVWLDKGHLTSWILIDDPRETPASVTPPGPSVSVEPPASTTPTTTHINAKQLTKNDTSINFTISDSSSGGLVYSARGESTVDTITKYISYTKVNRSSFYNDYSSLITDINTIEDNLNIGLNANSVSKIRDDMLNKFNRFKMAFPTTELSKTFAHVFFTRPDLNLYKSNGSLLDNVDNDPYFYYINRNSPHLLKSLTRDFSSKHDFNPYLSNRAGSFELKDEYVDVNEYGETFTGWKIKYGKHNIKSKTADNFSITYRDDDNFNVYKIHKAWTDYISKVYRGEFVPSRQNITTNTLDYAASVYYFLCGPDGETILFWTKYTGVFPSNTPSSHASWQSGNIVKMPEYSIQYEYSWKEDMVPTTLAEFNLNSIKQSNYYYARTYEPELASTGKTFVNAPFVETVIDKKTNKYDFKLRFRT